MLVHPTRCFKLSYELGNRLIALQRYFEFVLYAENVIIFYVTKDFFRRCQNLVFVLWALDSEI